MENHSDIQVDIQLIGKYLAGEALPAEAIAIDQWREKDEDNAETFRQIAMLWDSAFEGKTYQTPDDAQKWAQLSARLLPPVRQAPAKRLLTPLRIAAAVVLIIGASLVVYLLATKKETILFAKNATLEQTLPDHSVVRLSTGGRLSYPRDFNAHSRKVTLEGSADFDISASAAHPFVVEVGAVQIKVLGTTFNVKNETVAVTVYVKTGTVMMYDDKDSIILNAGFTGIYDKATQTLRLVAPEPKATKESLQSLTFNDQPLQEVAAALEKAYGVHIVFDNAALVRCRISTAFEQQSLDYVLEVIAISVDLKYKIDKNTVHFYGNGCN